MPCTYTPNAWAPRQPGRLHCMLVRTAYVPHQDCTHRLAKILQTHLCVLHTVPHRRPSARYMMISQVQHRGRNKWLPRESKKGRAQHATKTTRTQFNTHTQAL